MKKTKKTLLFFPQFFFWPCAYETGCDYHGQQGWLPKPLPMV